MNPEFWYLISKIALHLAAAGFFIIAAVLLVQVDVSLVLYLVGRGNPDLDPLLPGVILAVLGILVREIADHEVFS